jgi:hypothetical protein
MTHRQRVGTMVSLVVLGRRCSLPSLAEAVACQPLHTGMVGSMMAYAKSPRGCCAPSAIATGGFRRSYVYTFAAPVTGLRPWTPPSRSPLPSRQCATQATSRCLSAWT